MKESDNPATKRMDITMNVRTYIATAALEASIGAASMVANALAHSGSPYNEEAKELLRRTLDKQEIARDAVAYADALIAELSKPVGDKP